MRRTNSPSSSLARAVVVTGLLAVVVGAADAHAFRFLCNSILADGSSQSDGCGACSASSAARWDAFQVDFRFDDTVRPPEETLAEWQQHQTATIANWNNVEGQALFISDIGSGATREFGVINGENSIFWITNQNEFFDKVGSGIDSILGVTLAPYNCGSPRRDGILDADLVMNGTGSFDWDPFFNGKSPVVSTMTHEMGHAIGLGHPCTDCVSTAIMSATGGGPDDSEVPLFDDVQAISALYPGSPGGLGTACTSDATCDNNLCVTVPISGANRSFCSQTCNGSCPNGMVCAAVAGEGNVCVFSNANLAAIGAACGPPGCVDECTGADIQAGCNVCIPVDNNGNSQCFGGCRPQSGNAGCGADETCVGFGCSTNNDCGGGTCSNGECQNAGVCLAGGTPALRGQACGQTAGVGCADGLSCVTDGNSQDGTCLGNCVADGSGCQQNENCLFLFGSNTEGACFPAGAGVEGDACSDFDGCARGLLCLGGACEQRCDRDFTCHTAGQTCSPIGVGGMSTCSTPGEGEGEGDSGEGEGDVGEGEGDAGGDCDPTRGNFDCAQGFSCNDAGACVSGEGPTGTFGLCDDDDDCSGGLCSNGVCTRPCDVADGCPEGYACDEEAISGGLCRPESCRDNEAVCDDAAGFTCTYTAAKRYACAKGAPATICSCTTASPVSSPRAGVLALVLVGALARRRRR